MSQTEYSEALAHPGVRRMFEHLCKSYGPSYGERYLAVTLSQIERGGHSNEKLGPGEAYTAVLSALCPDNWLRLREVAERLPNDYKRMKRSSLSGQMVRLVEQGIVERRGEPTRYQYRKTSKKTTLSIQNNGYPTPPEMD